MLIAGFRIRQITLLLYCQVLIEFSLKLWNHIIRTVVDTFPALIFLISMHFQVDPYPKDLDPPVTIWQIWKPINSRDSYQSKFPQQIRIELQRVPKKYLLKILKTGWCFLNLFMNSKISCIFTSFKKEISILSHMAKKLQAC